MNWEAIAAVGQVLGSVAVVVTLWYLAVQTRHTRREMRRSISQHPADGQRELMSIQVTNERWARAYLKANTALGRVHDPFVRDLTERLGLTHEEAMILFWHEFAWWNLRAQTIAYIDDLLPGDRIQFDGRLRAHYGDWPTTRSWYESTKVVLNPDAVRYIDNLLAQPN